MTATTTDLTTSTPSRAPLLAALGVGTAAVLTAVGTFWDITDNEDVANDTWAHYLPVLGMIAVATAIVYGTVVRTADRGNPGRRAVVLGVVGFLSNVVFWAGLPMILATASVACALVRKDRRGSLGSSGTAALVLAALTTAAAVFLAITG